MLFRTFFSDLKCEPLAVLLELKVIRMTEVAFLVLPDELFLDAGETFVQAACFSYNDAHPEKPIQ